MELSPVRYSNSIDTEAFLGYQLPLPNLLLPLPCLNVIHPWRLCLLLKSFSASSELHKMFFLCAPKIDSHSQWQSWQHSGSFTTLSPFLACELSENGDSILHSSYYTKYFPVFAGAGCAAWLVVEHLPNMQKALRSIPSRKNRKKWITIPK